MAETKNKARKSVLERGGEGKTKRSRAEAWKEGEREMNKYGEGVSMTNSC